MPDPAFGGNGRGTRKTGWIPARRDGPTERGEDRLESRSHTRGGAHTGSWLHIGSRLDKGEAGDMGGKPLRGRGARDAAVFRWVNPVCSEGRGRERPLPSS
jgi:hypothetical protein